MAQHRSIRRVVTALRTATRGAALIEFAVAAPVMLAILMGTIGYGGYFWRAHALQQAANDAARAALGGLTATERAQLARDSAFTDLAALGGLSRRHVNVGVSEASGSIRVAISYDSVADPFMNLGIVPMPDRLIRRVASVRLGGL